MGGFAFVIGAVLIAVGVVLIRNSANYEVMIALGASLVGAGAILCGSGVIAVAIERLGGKRAASEAAPSSESKGD